MHVVEQHCIDKRDSRYAVIDRVAFASKNLYNAGLYEMRQAFIHQGRRMFYNELYYRMKPHEAYKALPAKVAQQVLRMLDKNWESYVQACQAYKQKPDKFLGHPHIPKYKDKQKGRNVLVFTAQAVSKKGLKRGIVQPSGVPIEIQTKQRELHQVRIVPRKGFYVVEVVKVTEESYTSKASLLDLDLLPVRLPDDGTKHTFSGKRVKRGLYRASNGRYIHADINGAGNIIRKVAPDAFQQAEGVEDGKGILESLVVHPWRFIQKRRGDIGSSV